MIDKGPCEKLSTFGLKGVSGRKRGPHRVCMTRWGQWVGLCHYSNVGVSESRWGFCDVMRHTVLSARVHLSVYVCGCCGVGRRITSIQYICTHTYTHVCRHLDVRKRVHAC